MKKKLTKKHRENISKALKGRKFSDEHRHKISIWAKTRIKFQKEITEKARIANTGVPKTPEHNLKNSIAHMGEKSPNWKGGITPINYKIRNSARYKKWRKAVFERDNWTCQHCCIRGGKLNADHIKPFATFPDLRFDIKNGRTLCEDCHKKTNSYGVKTLYQNKLLVV